MAEEGSPEAILIVFYAKYEPDFANIEKVSRITRSFRKKAAKQGGDWEEMLYAAMKGQRGEDPRTLYQEIAAAKRASESTPARPAPAEGTAVARLAGAADAAAEPNRAPAAAAAAEPAVVAAGDAAGGGGGAAALGLAEQTGRTTAPPRGPSSSVPAMPTFVTTHGTQEQDAAAAPPPLLINEGSPGRDDLLRCLAAMERTHPLAASCLKAIANHGELYRR
jgi:hypothetical protein